MITEMKEIQEARATLKDDQRVSTHRLLEIAMGLAADESAMRKLVELRKHLEPNKKLAVGRLTDR